jgi:hypothetical protein
MTTEIFKIKRTLPLKRALPASREQSPPQWPYLAPDLEGTLLENAVVRTQEKAWMTTEIWAAIEESTASI